MTVIKYLTHFLLDGDSILNAAIKVIT